jgi:superfamily I DNA/RNA helicase
MKVSKKKEGFYVDITRAMKELFITCTKHRVKYGKETPSIPLRFLEEIPDDV